MNAEQQMPREPAPAMSMEPRVSIDQQPPTSAFAAAWMARKKHVSPAVPAAPLKNICVARRAARRPSITAAASLVLGTHQRVQAAAKVSRVLKWF
ncbi:hypothetical protein B0T17DRAFT_617638 [Bombardia bombarda]|uniref:Uncharacterized protein n=1 Tax=Bombardia bombarda TaxID=252184 RepID=A0AA40C162_9PEZI|nr:hypothetical protein B0T17DRAFT_617638 [Bombardia bombarda]